MIAHRKSLRLLPKLYCWPVWILVLSALAQAGETNLPTTTQRVRRPISTTQELAAEHERAGRKREAAALYEEIARGDFTARKVLSQRLVAIYLETGETNKVLAWVREAMRGNPDPPAYLAAVQSGLGQWSTARDILEKELAANTNTVRAVTLRWQLADVCAEQGDSAKTRKLLKEAADAAKGTPLEPAALKRLRPTK
jgi:tetratricopeptide (TPR) repeat protein